MNSESESIILKTAQEIAGYLHEIETQHSLILGCLFGEGDKKPGRELPGYLAGLLSHVSSKAAFLASQAREIQSRI